MTELTLNLDLLKSKEAHDDMLSFDHLAILQLIYEGKKDDVTNIFIPPFTIRDLEVKGYLKVWGTVLSIREAELREKGIKLFQKTIEIINFDEFYDLYPKQVGSRILRTISHDSKDYKEAKKKYLSVVKTKKLHDRVVNALKREVKIKQESSKMSYMQGIIVYINQRTWEKWMNTDVIEQVQQEQKLIEREL